MSAELPPPAGKEIKGKKDLKGSSWDTGDMESGTMGQFGQKRKTSRIFSNTEAK